MFARIRYKGCTLHISQHGFEFQIITLMTITTFNYFTTQKMSH